MKHQAQYLVVYKDSTRAPNKYFGPFVSPEVAQDFMEGLPTPLMGGGKTFKHMSPYTYDECGIARDVILRVRTHGSYLSV